jgi:uncharacterized metal-binding protein
MKEEVHLSKGLKGIIKRSTLARMLIYVRIINKSSCHILETDGQLLIETEYKVTGFLLSNDLDLSASQHISISQMFFSFRV